MDIDKLPWTEWRSISDATDSWGPAVYEIRLAVGGNPRPINRFGGTDPHGVLTIGESKSMEQRRLDFITAIDKCYKHSAGNLLHLILKFCQMPPEVNREAIQYHFAPMPTQEDAKHAEALLVRRYILSYAEPPPLNSAIPDRYGTSYGEWETVVAS